MEDKDKYISELESEVTHLREELRVKELQEKHSDAKRSDILYMLEDLNETTEAIDKNRKQWETTFDAISDPIFISDDHMRLIRVNRAYMEAAGLPFSRIIGRYFYDIFPVMDRPVNSSGDEGVTSKIVDETEIAVPEMEKVFKIRCFPLGMEESVEVSIVHILEDITDQSMAHDRTRALLELNRRFNSNVNLDFRFMETCKYAVKLGYDMAWAGSLDANRSGILVRAHFRRDGGIFPEIGDDRGTVGAPGADPATRAVETKDVVVVNNLDSISGGKAFINDSADKCCKSLAAFPMMHLDESIGVLVVFNYKDDFPERDIDFLKSFTNHVSSSIRNSQFFRDIKDSEKRVKEEMELTENLLTLSRASFATTDLDRLLSRVAECSSNIMASDYSLIYLWNAERGAYTPAKAYGLPARHQPVFRSTALTIDDHLLDGLSSEAVIRHGEGIFNEFPEIKTFAIIPLVSIDKRLGLNIVGFLKERSFKPREILLMDGMASQISVALHEAHLYRESLRNSMELSRRVETIQVLYEIDRAILSSLDINDILETASRMAVRLIPSDSVFVGLSDKEMKSYTYAAGFGVEGIAKGEKTSFANTTAFEVVRSATPEFIADLREVHLLLPLERSFLDSGLLSFVRVPLIVKGRTIGFLSVGARRAAAFTSDDLYTLEKLAGQMAIGLENARLLKDLEELFLGTISSLTEVIDAKCKWTAGHSRRVTLTAKAIGDELGLDRDALKRLEIASNLHDIGKIGTYESILNKPEKLTEDESRIMRRHAVKGAEILAHIKQLEDVLPSIRAHQESYDGSGYPDGLRGSEIPFYARIIAVADTIDSMVADRPYRPGMPAEAVISELRRCSGVQFDPEVVDAFLRVHQAGKSILRSTPTDAEKAS